MKMVAVFMMFSTWLSVEHGTDIPNNIQVFTIILTFMLCI